MADRRFIEELSKDNIADLPLYSFTGGPLKFSDIYKFKSFLGKGSFGYVVSALHRTSNQVVALKVSIHSDLK